VLVEGLLKLDHWLIQGNEKHETAAVYSAGRFMFPTIDDQSRALVAPTSAPSARQSERQANISELIPYFLAYAAAEWRLSRETLAKYQESMRCVLRITGDMPPQELRREHVLLVKGQCLQRNLSAARIASLMYALRSFLKFCRLAVGLTVIDPKEARPPRLPKREVLFLTPEEVADFVAAIPIKKTPRTFDMRMLCFRALVEVLLGTGMRLSEALSLTRDAINLETGEAKIVGKGNKERTVFFSPRALNWIKEYLTRRHDTRQALFTVCLGKPLTRATAVTWFRRFRQASGIKKKVTAHVLRHTVATTLLFNGCPIGHIREILGHEHLVTTCKYYLGADKRAAKSAHAKYLSYEEPQAA